MSHWKSSGLSIFAIVCLLGETTGSAHAQCQLNIFGCATEWNNGSVINLGGLPGSKQSLATAINDVGQVVGTSFSIGTLIPTATEWSGGRIIEPWGTDLKSYAGKSVTA